MGILKINYKAIVVLLSVTLLCSGAVIAKSTDETTNKVFIAKFSKIASLNGNNVELKVKDENKLKINVTEPKKVNGQVFKSKDEMMGQYFQQQKKMDIEDIKGLWEATVDRNPVIKFALKKLAMPPEQRRVHSSVMAKTVSTLISGVSILPGLLGADSITSSVASAGGTLANKAIAAKEAPKEFPLTDTELIHLARLVEDLQNRTIKSYYDYKGDLEALKVARQELVKQNMAYSNALRAKDQLAIITTKVMYDNALKDELNLKQDAKSHRLDLERLAGAEILDKLKLGKIIIDDSQEKVATSPTSNKSTDSNAYEDKSTNELSQEIAAEIKDNKNDMLSDLNILWNAAVGKSETIRFAILKLSNPDGNVEKASAVKKILTPLTGVASIVGLGASDPITATSAIFSGTMMSSLLSSDNAELNSHLSKVTDTDLVLLAQETDNLQQKLVNLYCNYIGALADLNFMNQVVDSRQKDFETIKDSASELQTISNVFYKESISNQYQARQRVLSTRVALEQFVGNEAIASLDKNIQHRLATK